MDLGNKILKLRKKAGLSQEQLGEKINVTRQTISNWELGETGPNPEQLKELSKVLNISVDELLDNDINNTIVTKVSNTECITKKSFLLLKILVFIILVFIILVIAKIIVKNYRESGRKIEESIHCIIYGEEHTFSINYYELTGQPFALGGDPYFSDILNLDRYNDAHQIFNIINDYVKKNGGTCITITDRNLNDVVNLTIKEDTLTKTGVKVVITENIDYAITYGEAVWLEKYNYETNKYERVKEVNDRNCGFNSPAYSVTLDKPLELKQDWSCMYGELDKGLYRLFKEVSFDSDNPVNSNDLFEIFVEFEII